MTILWCGGEDVDFPTGYTVNITSGYTRGGFSRVSLYSTQRIYPIISTKFGDTGITSCWVSCQLFMNGTNVSNKGFGLCNINGTYTGGLFVGTDTTDTSKLAIHKWDGTIFTQVASGASGTLLTGYLYKYDIQIISYGVNCTVNVYKNGNLLLSYTGDVTVPNITNLNYFIFLCSDWAFSEIIVADTDTRHMSLGTLYPNAAGDTSTNWTGAYTAIDETTLDTSDTVYSSTNDADFQSNLSATPTGTFSVKAVKVYARAADPTATMGIQLGVKTNSTVNVGTTQNCSYTWETKERIMELNPVTGSAWTTAEIDALQLNIRAKVL